MNLKYFFKKTPNIKNGNAINVVFIWNKSVSSGIRLKRNNAMKAQMQTTAAIILLRDDEPSRLEMSLIMARE